MKRLRIKKSYFQDIAKGRIQILFDEAKKRFSSRPELSNRYVQLARRIAMKYKVKIPSELKKRFCKHCHHYLVPSKNCRVRIRNRKLVYYCIHCRNYMRFPYSKSKTLKYS
ncbi:ribonuclease P [Candidatus Woesearchaeota archaeon]|nr:ribonuclease P [Candidatus Woesearchaeota archaeon]